MLAIIHEDLKLLFIHTIMQHSKLLWAFIAIVIVIGAIAAFYSYSPSEPSGKTYPLPVTIGLLKYIPVLDASFNGFKQGMTELGYVEGKDVIYKEVSANGNLNKLQEVARDLLTQGVDIIYAMPVEEAVGA